MFCIEDWNQILYLVLISNTLTNVYEKSCKKTGFFLGFSVGFSVGFMILVNPVIVRV